MIFKDSELLGEAYSAVVKQKTIANHPIVNKTAPVSAPLVEKKFNKDELSFKSLHSSVIAEQHKKVEFGPSAISNTYDHDILVWKLRRLSNGEISNINKEEQYIVSWKDPKKHNGQQEQPLKGESVSVWLDDIVSIRRAFPEEP
jgi:hypothetical protein